MIDRMETAARALDEAREIANRYTSLGE